jgi:hypothetical protein
VPLSSRGTRQGEVPIPSVGMGRVALAAGIGVVALTAASQTGLLGGHDFLLIAAVGLVAAIFCVVIALDYRSRQAFVGAAMSAAPIVLLLYYLMNSEG